MSPPECVTVLSGELGTVYLSPSNVSNLFACLKFLVETWSSEEGAVVVAHRNTPDQIYWGSLSISPMPTYFLCPIFLSCLVT